MASAMKKLKTLHNINTTNPPSYRDHHNHIHHNHHNHSQEVVNSAPAHGYINHKLPTTPPSSNSSPTDKPKRQHRSRIPIPVYYQQHLTPPISPTGSSVSNSAPPSPQQNQRQRSAAPPSQSYRQETQKYYAEMLRSARQALHQLQHHHHAPPAPQVAQQQQQQQRSLYPVLSEIATQNQQQKRHPALPGGGAFLVLTQDDPHPAICIPNSPAASIQQHHHHQRAPAIPTLTLTGPQQFPAVANTNPRTAAPQTPARSSKRKPPPLTKNAVELILQDTRMARWQRVQGYVREQRKLVVSEQNEERLNGLRRASNATENPIEVPNEEMYAEIDRKNFLLDQLDRLPEIQERSLWSGGSAGTNGVDEFVWDDDEEGFQGDADMLDAEDWANRERMKREYQRQQLEMQQQAQLLRLRQQQQQAEAVEERFMKEEEARAAVADHRRRYQRPAAAAADTPPRTPTSSGSSSRQQTQTQTAQATPPQLKAYTASFFKSKTHLTPHHQQQQRTQRQDLSHSRPGTAGSGSNCPGYKRQSIGRGIGGVIATSNGKTGSFGSVDGAVFRMDGEQMDLDCPNNNNLPLPSSYLTRATQYQQQHQQQQQSPRVPASPSYCSPTFASLGKSRTGAAAAVPARSSPTPAAAGGQAPAVEKSLREYMEALRRYEVRCAADVEQTDLVNGSGSSGKRRRRTGNIASNTSAGFY